MDLFARLGDVPYLAVFIATMIEGEAVFVAACFFVSLGKLNPAGVLLAAALGGCLGDQVIFYCLRGRLGRWCRRLFKLDEKQEKVAEFVKKNSIGMILACRFMPGLRVAIPLACSYADVAPALFSGLSLISSIAWAASIMLIVSWFGPSFFSRFGLDVWWTSLLPALLFLALLLFWHWRTRSRGRPRKSYGTTENAESTEKAVRTVIDG